MGKETKGQGFPGVSAGRNLPANAGDAGSIPGLGRSPGEGNGNPLQYSCLENSMDRRAWWAAVSGVAQSWTQLKRLSSSSSSSRVAQTVNNLPAMWETWVRSLGWEDPPEKEMATYSSILAWRIPWTEEPGRLYSPWGHKESDVTEQLNKKQQQN